jgi:hypothetical protein
MRRTLSSVLSLVHTHAQSVCRTLAKCNHPTHSSLGRVRTDNGQTATGNLKKKARSRTVRLRHHVLLMPWSTSRGLSSRFIRPDAPSLLGLLKGDVLAAGKPEVNLERNPGARISHEIEIAFVLLESLVDVRGFEPLTPCLQSRWGKTLKCFDGVAYTDFQQNSHSPNVPKLYRVFYLRRTE